MKTITTQQYGWQLYFYRNGHKVAECCLLPPMPRMWPMTGWDRNPHIKITRLGTRLTADEYLHIAQEAKKHASRCNCTQCTRTGFTFPNIGECCYKEAMEGWYRWEQALYEQSQGTQGRPADH